ncbi:DoxX family membrane protein [Haloplanus sp. GCM10025708]|uniref:DoxX family membrane protein n=1 Tax=Haloferacaceae TaxID=1644056 RepID=UPI00361B4099
MAHESEDGDIDIRRNLRPVLRIGIAALLLVPGASKFITYGTSVRFFESLGLPAPAVLVPVVGSLELAAAGLLLLDQLSWLAGLLIIPIMVVAAITAGPTWQNLGVLAAAVVLIGLDTQEVTGLV